ncbi:MAG: hypothetical protein KatS3mg129_2200 [Leptospiraceae bacterium]|nr:MAG: hypothetical protein KatS3mg129_2200 [Leptospiraceae bacterium]
MNNLKFLFFLLTIFLILSCNGMTDNQVTTITGKSVYSRSKVIELFQISSLSLKERCSGSNDALNYMINEGFADQFTRIFYEKKSVDACLILFFSMECPIYKETSALINFYKSFIFNCKLKPVELFQ